MAFRGKVSKQYKVYGMKVMSCMQTPFEVKRLSRFRRFVEPKQEETKANAARRPGKAETAIKRQKSNNAKSNNANRATTPRATTPIEQTTPREQPRQEQQRQEQQGQ